MDQIVKVDDNVYAFPASRVRRVGPANPQAAAFLSKVLPIFKEQTGLDYMKVKDALHGGRRDFMEFVMEAVDTSSSPEDFVRFLVSSNGLMTNSELLSGQEVTEYNDVKIAILEFSNEYGDGWKRDLHGGISKIIESADHTPFAVAYMSPIIHGKSREVGFAIQVFERDLTADSEVGFALQKNPSKRFAGFDLEDAYEPFNDYCLAFDDVKVAHLR